MNATRVLRGNTSKEPGNRLALLAHKDNLPVMRLGTRARIVFPANSTQRPGSKDVNLAFQENTLQLLANPSVPASAARLANTGREWD